MPLGQGQPVYPAPEMPGVVVRDVPKVEQPQQNEAQDMQVRDTVRSNRLCQAINPPSRCSKFVVHLRRNPQFPNINLREWKV